MKPYLVALGLSLVISWILTPAVKKLAFHLGAVDRPNARKVHHRIMPRMGGLAIFIGFMTAALTTLELTTDVIGILLGGAAIAAVGMVDDMIQLSAKVKLVGQIVAALIPVLFGVRIEWLNNPWGGYFYLDYLSVPFTVFWIVSLTNVVNLIDGLDGLAAGVSAIASVTVIMVALQQGMYPVAIMTGFPCWCHYWVHPLQFQSCYHIHGRYGKLVFGLHVGGHLNLWRCQECSDHCTFGPCHCLGASHYGYGLCHFASL